jgi:hypothetical protein
MSISKIIIFLSVLLFNQSVFAQDIDFSWKKFVNQESQELNISTIEVFEADHCITHYRIWNGSQLIDLCKLNESEFEGQVFNYVTKHYKRWGKKKTKIVFESLSVSNDSTENLMNYLKAENFELLPDDKEVNGYPQNGLDGETYIFEVKTKENYRLYTYWSPMSDDYIDGDIPEVVHVRNIINKLFEEYGFGESFEKFMNSLPKGTYYYNGPFSFVKL